jgi:hypothetical protein
MTGRPILAIDTSGTRALVALGAPDGRLIDERRWQAGYRHGEELLTRTDELLTTRSRWRTWAGSSSGPDPERSPACASGSRRPRRSRTGWASRSPASPRRGAGLAAADLSALESRPRSCCRPDLQIEYSSSPGRQRWSRAETEPEIPEGAALVAVDLPDRAPAEALALGARRRRSGSRPRCSALGAARLAAGGDDVARLVPEYVTLPRGITA